ncbi:hypothetical protein PLESTB_001821600 [Pleodorina starrii]|uniref:Disease resistance R13L4/SHOC-2-like LRR domain-containing protein n=1 Tax=Pleodorina starrii TaxID=330485 RepID=A0A9W6C1B2_9CHLO|nr:hypothetical protein PLESTM_000967000 [Pleodorina starrii]GLC61939.1 hypothetical protein PLESTB_001821600 [Pleodorina starrii]
MDGDSRCWASIPADALAYIINDCCLCQSDIASIRLVCMHWRSTTNNHLKSLAPACTSLELVADIAQRFPYLTNCDLTRCDTRLVGLASLCRDASARLSTLLVALSRMPSLTSLHISDTFSERMGQKHWASLLCAQTLVQVPQPSVPLEAPAAPPLLDGAAAAFPVGVETQALTGGNWHHATAASNADSTLASVGAALAAARVDPTPGVSSTASSSSPHGDAAGASVAAPATSTKSNADVADCVIRDLELQPAFGSAPPALSGGAETEVAFRTSDVVEDEDVRDGNRVASGSACNGVPGAENALPTISAVAAGLASNKDDTQRSLMSHQQACNLCVQLEASTAMAGGPGVDSCTAAAATAGAELEAKALPPPAVEAPATPPPRSPPPPPPPLVVMSAAELADPGIKSFARATSRADATNQHAFWLPDWCGRLAGLQELHIRGRQRPSAGLAPCLFWLHAGRTAPQLTSLSLVRLSLVTLPEQLQHLTALTRLVAQDCSLSLMPRGLAAGLSQLQYMDLSLNGLTALPPDFTQLTSLKHLDLQRNKLASLPADIGRLSSVTCLLLNNNQLRQLPASLAALRHVEVLSCSYNWLGGMGPSLPLLCSLPRLRSLELACVSDVRCRLVPPQELRLLAANLSHLDLAANNLVPADVLGTLTSVRSLVLSDCGLLAVPPWVRRLAPSLQHLDLSNNSLSELPTWLSACTRLRYLSIAHNRLSIRVPPSVLEQMPQLEVVESE